MFILLVLALCLSPSLQSDVIGTVLFRSRRSTLQNSPDGVPELFQLRIDEKREAFHYQQTVVIRDSGKDDDKVRRCELAEIYDEEALKNLRNNLLLMFDLEIQDVTIDKIFRLIEDCDSVDEDSSRKNRSNKPKKHHGNAIFHGIYPGTKWCGFGDIARSFHDLSSSRNVDRCCRAHDFCPLKVLSKDGKFNLQNNAKYTKSHCLCDEAFHACLKKDNGITAKIIGNLYFKVAHPKCIRGFPENPNEIMEFVNATRKW